MSQTNVNVPGGSSESGMGAGMIAGLVLALVVIGFVVWWFVLNGGGGGGGDGTPLPSDVLPSLPLPSALLSWFALA